MSAGYPNLLVTFYEENFYRIYLLKLKPHQNKIIEAAKDKINATTDLSYIFIDFENDEAEHAEGSVRAFCHIHTDR